MEELYNTGPLRIENHKEIMLDMAILFDGQYREEDLDMEYLIMSKNTAEVVETQKMDCTVTISASTNPFDTQH